MSPSRVTVIGAGIAGIVAASYLLRDGHEVTVIDRAPPGEGCSFGNAGCISPGSVTPLAGPGILWQVPGWLRDPLGPLALRWAYLPRALPWLIGALHASWMNWPAAFEGFRRVGDPAMAHVIREWLRKKMKRYGLT